MSETGDSLKKAVYANMNVPGLVSDVMDDVLEPALDKVVADSSNALDDILKAAIYPTLAKEVKQLVQAQWDKLMAAPAEG